MLIKMMGFYLAKRSGKDRFCVTFGSRLFPASLRLVILPVALIVVLMLRIPVSAQGTGATVSLPTIEVVETSPLPGSEIERDRFSANVLTLGSSSFDHTKTPDLLQAMFQNLPGVSLSDQTGNPFQLSLDYRGFNSGPVPGTPQGLAVYQNGVRINEVFGDIVNWDLIPEIAIDHLTLMPSNPIYGLNALGGAISIEMKNGFNYHGYEGEVRGGSFGRIGFTGQAGGQNGDLAAYVAADIQHDEGWRNFSPSDVRRMYAILGARGEKTEFHVTFTGASNNFRATAATPVQLLNQNWASTYTVPQTTQNQLAFLTASAAWKPTDTVSFQGNMYYRGFWQSHVDGNGTGCPKYRLPSGRLLVLP